MYRAAILSSILLLLCCQLATAQTPTPTPTVKVIVSQPLASQNCVVVPSAPVNPKIKTWKYRGKKYGFCCTNCRNEFSKNKKKYANFQAQREKAQ